MEDRPGVLEVMLQETTLTAESPVVGRRHTDMKPGPVILLTVSDTGHGMSSETLERIFEPYFTTKEMGKGTGMGLAVVHGIIQSYDGAIQVKSKPGQGAVFNVFLPLCDPPTQFGASDPPSVEGGTETIMFVDDEVQIKSAGKNILESYGYTVYAHSDAREALEAFKKDPGKFDLVITDLTMPHLTGFQLARELVSIRPTLPVILCTGYRDSISPEEAEQMGIRTIVTKPLTHTALGRVVRQILEGEPQTEV
jgi:CheY-like chemotaxis protein